MSLQTVGGIRFEGNVDASTFGFVECYQALLTQSSTSAPVPTIIKNDLSETPVWAYSSTGTYTLTLTNAWRVNKTIVHCTPNQLAFVCCALTSANVITLSTYNSSGTLANGLLTAAVFDVCVIRQDRS